MRRREFITLIGGAATAWPLAARAQQQATPVIGFLHSGSLGGTRNLLIALRKGLAEFGYMDGQNVAIEYRWAEGHFDRLPPLAAELIQRGAAIIITGGIGSALGARTASETVPLVFLAAEDPVKYGLVASLNRPGGTATGLAWFTSELFAKRLELLRELVPAASMIGALTNPRSPEVAQQSTEIESAARMLGQSIKFVNASDAADFEQAFVNLVEWRVGALIVSNDAFFNSMRERIVALAARHRIPAIYDRREYATVGGLLSYGTSGLPRRQNNALADSVEKLRPHL